VCVLVDLVNVSYICCVVEVDVGVCIGGFSECGVMRDCRVLIVGLMALRVEVLSGSDFRFKHYQDSNCNL